MTKQQAILELIHYGRRMYGKGLVVASDGNLSLRWSEDRLLITRGGVCKGELTADDIIECDMQGVALSAGKVSSEIRMHLAVYALRADVDAVIHAHPPSVIALSLAGVSLTEPYLPEITLTIGSVPTTTFAVPSSAENAEVIKKFILHNDAIILDRHGSLTVGENLQQAFWKLERLEFVAQVILKAKSAGVIKTLSPSELAQVLSAAERYQP